MLHTHPSPTFQCKVRHAEAAALSAARGAAQPHIMFCLLNTQHKLCPLIGAAWDSCIAERSKSCCKATRHVLFTKHSTQTVSPHRCGMGRLQRCVLQTVPTAMQHVTISLPNTQHKPCLPHTMCHRYGMGRLQRCGRCCGVTPAALP
jgi:hypothetical protein